MLEIVSASGAGSAAVAGGVVSQMTVTYMMPWGSWMLVWSVPATVAYPFLVPLLVGYGLTSLVPLEVLRRYRKKWKGISDALNRDFWARGAEEEIKVEFFGRTVSSDHHQLGNFFGIHQEEEQENNVGKYMPLNMGGGADDHDNEEEEEGSDEEVQRQCENVAATFDINAAAQSSGPQQNGLRRFNQRLGRSVQNLREQWRNRDGHINNDKEKEKEKEKEGCILPPGTNNTDVDASWSEDRFID